MSQRVRQIDHGIPFHIPFDRRAEYNVQTRFAILQQERIAGATGSKETLKPKSSQKLKVVPDTAADATFSAQT